MMKCGKTPLGKKHILLILAGLLLIVKLPVLLSFFPQYRESDELAIGAIGKAFLDGLLMPFFDYQYTPNDSGNLLMAVPIALCFKLFGCSLFSLKLLALFFNLSVLALLYLFLARNFSKRAAALSGLLFILSPQIFTERSSLVQGTHFEPIIFSMSAMYIFYEIFFNGKAHARYFVLFGLICGFGSYFSYTFLITLACCVLFWCAFDRRFFLKKKFFVFALSFIFGFSPWIFSSLFYSGRNAILHGGALQRHFFRGRFFDILANFRNIVTYDMPAFLSPKNLGSFLNVSISSIYYAAFLFSFVMLAWLHRKAILRPGTGCILRKRHEGHMRDNGIPKELFPLAYCVLFFFLYSISDFRDWISADDKGYWAYRYFMPLFPLVIIIISLFLDRIWGSKDRRISFCAYFLFTTLAMGGLFSTIGMVSFRDFGKILKQNGYSYDELGRLIGENNVDRSGIKISPVDRFYRNYATLSCYEGVGWGIGSFYDVDEFYTLVSTVQAPYRPSCYYGIGEAFAGTYADTDTQDKEFSRSLKVMSEKYWPYFIEGLGAGLWLFDEEQIDIDTLNAWRDKIPSGYRQYFYRGVIRSCFSSESGYDIGRALGLIRIIPREYRAYCYEGLGAAIAEIFGSDLKESFRLINLVDEKYRPYCAAGFKSELASPKVYML